MNNAFSFKVWHPLPIYWSTCPTCTAGIEKSAIKTIDLRTPERNTAFRRGDFNPTDDGGDYTATYTCPKCSNYLAAAGEWSGDIDWIETDDGEMRQVWITIYRPRWLSICPGIIETPNTTPKAITEAAQSAARLFWTDHNACGAALRQIVELFLDEQGIPRTETTTKKKEERHLSFEARIEKFVTAIEVESRDAADEYEKLLRATKFKGNDAVHGVERLKPEDLRTISQLLSRVLQMRYTNSTQLLKEAARIIAGRHSRRMQKRLASAASAPTPLSKNLVSTDAPSLHTAEMEAPAGAKQSINPSAIDSSSNS
ncbi:DUF4145 domain-containing protein [Corallococcus interemptor]|nr:DUF4145 domain-containing protein [Corallococcus interemptor]